MRTAKNVKAKRQKPTLDIKLGRKCQYPFCNKKKPDSLNFVIRTTFHTHENAIIKYQFGCCYRVCCDYCANTFSALTATPIWEQSNVQGDLRQSNTKSDTVKTNYTSLICSCVGNKLCKSPLLNGKNQLLSI